MALHRNWLLLGVCSVSGACASLSGPAGSPDNVYRRAHEQPYVADEKKTGDSGGQGQGAGQNAPTQRDWNQLNERVRFLERRLSDMDVKIGLMAERVESTSNGAPPQWTEAGSPTGFASPPEEPAVIEILPSPDAPLPAETAKAPTSLSSNSASTPFEAPERKPIRRETAAAPVAAGGGRDGGAMSETVLSSPAVSDIATPGFMSVDDVADVKGAYHWAQRQRRAGKWQDAERVFLEIYRKFPKHSLGDNALYWVGVVQASRGAPRQAIESFAQVPVRFPRSAKIPDALFGMARAHEELGEPLLAEVLYRQLVEEYPRAEKRGDAKRALVRLTHPNP